MQKVANAAVKQKDVETNLQTNVSNVFSPYHDKNRPDYF